MKRTLLGVLLGLTMLSAPAHAVVIDNFGVNPTSADGAFSNDPTDGPAPFFDQYLFQLNGTSFVTVVTGSNTFASGGITGPFGIQSFTGAIYQIVGGVDTAPGVSNGGLDILMFGPTLATLCASGLCQEFDANGILNAGNYYLALAGVAGSLAGYGGNLSVSETPIPGAAWLFGSVIAGGVLLRRRRKSLV